MTRFFAGWLLTLLFALALGSLALAETGIASWYGTESGSRTANGERFTGREMTAAHRSLPFGTKVKVTNLKNGRSVVVRINDRGPAKRLRRMIDLSHTAAKKLGIDSRGVAKVRIQIVRER